LTQLSALGKFSGELEAVDRHAAKAGDLHSHLVTFDRSFARLLGRNELTVLSPTET